MYTVAVSTNGFAYVLLDGDVFCEIHRTHAGGLKKAITRAKMIAELLNKVVA